MSNEGRLIIFEGSDGAGKSTLSSEFCSRLPKRNGVPHFLSFPGREKGTIGEWIYRLHHCHSDFGIATITPASLQTLHVAAHLDSVERTIIPALNSGRWVVMDRFWWSTWVYGLVSGVPRSIIDALIDVERKAWEQWKPSVAFYVNRRTPLRDEPLERWHQLNSAYLELIAEEKEKYPVHMLCNDGDVEDSLHEALAFATARLL